MKGIFNFIPLSGKKNIFKPIDLKQKTQYFFPNYYFILFWILVKNSEQVPSRDGLALLRMSNEHSPNSLTKEAGKVLTQTMRPPRKIQNQCQQQILPSWQVLAWRTCIYIRTMQIKSFFLTTGSNTRLKKQIFQLMAIFSPNSGQVLFINTEIRAEAQALLIFWGLHIKISATKGENFYKYVNHGENEKEMGRKQRT